MCEDPPGPLPYDYLICVVSNLVLPVELDLLDQFSMYASIYATVLTFAVS